MAAVSQALVLNTWFKLSRTDTHPFVVLQIQGTGSVIATSATATPLSLTEGFNLPEGLHSFLIADHKDLYVRLTSGSATVVWSDTEVAFDAVDVSTGSPTVSVVTTVISSEEPP